MAGSAPILTILPHASALTEDQGIEQFGSRRRAIERDDEGAPTRSGHLQGLTATNDDARGAWRPAKPPSPADAARFTSANRSTITISNRTTVKMSRMSVTVTPLF